MGSLRVMQDVQAPAAASKDTSIVAIEHHAIEQATTQPASSAMMQSSVGQRPLRKADKCALGRCRCRCHTQGAVCHRLWTFTYTPLSMILGDCDNPSCSKRKYAASFRVGLSQFGLNWAITAAIAIRSGRGGYSIDVSLRPQHVVPFDSEGFELLKRMVAENKVDQAISSFRTLYRRDPAMIHHVNPHGYGYIRVCLSI